MSRPNIILTGFMGSCKSTVGKLLSRELQYDFVDTDDLIEERCKMSVEEIFKIRGETVFRDMEAIIARELGALEGLVISTGGGLMQDGGNRAALEDSGRVFCLIATPKKYSNVSQERIQPDGRCLMVSTHWRTLANLLKNGKKDTLNTPG